MPSLKVWLLLICFLAAAKMNNSAAVFSPKHTDSQDGEGYPLQLLLEKVEKKTDNQRFIFPKARGLISSMEMLDIKRQPKPKRPMGNDIGTARLLDTSVARFPNGYAMNLSTQPGTTDRLEATLSAVFNLSTNSTPEQVKDEESAEVSRELHDIMDEVPTLPSIHLPHLQFYRDPEEEAINERITQIARQLAESALRKEYEEKKQSKNGPVISTKLEDFTTLKSVMNIVKPEPELQKPGKITPEEASIPATALDLTEANLNVKIQAKQKEKTVEKQTKTLKIGKSYVVSNTLPLVSHIPQETAQLQLIAEVQEIPHFMIHEGFHPRTPAPELIGPLLGGPPLKTEETTDESKERTSKSLDASKSNPGYPFTAVGLPTFLNLMSPRYGFQLNDLVVSIPAKGGFLPPIMSEDNEFRASILKRQ